MTHASSSGVDDLYRGIIQDVIDESKEAFFDENIDIEILYQIQKAWEEKINASGAADLNPKPVPTVRPNPPKARPSSSKIGMTIPQVDGAPHMSDSSDEDDEDDDARLNQMFDALEHDEGVSVPGIEEDPLNSNDDQSDDEDLDTLFESSNVIVCQFEKVNRSRNKWKFALKDGIMHIEGKDYCFQKCNGEAEW